MDIEYLREYCLALDRVVEKTPFGKFSPKFDSVLVFYICGHMFCMFDIDRFTGVTVKGEPERIARLHETRSSCSAHRTMNARYWIELRFGGDIPDSEILEMIRRSYDIVKTKYSRNREK